MEQKVISLKLGLAESAGEGEVLAAIGELLAAKAERDTLRTAVETARLAAIEGEVEAAIKLGKFAVKEKAHFVELGKTAGLESLRKTLECITPALRPSQVINPASAAFTLPNGKKWADLSDADRIELRAADYERYKELCEQEYGIKI